ncbi:MAG TPA: 50S ribosomal protein L2 [Candidatus Thermoplasmatota archaeon]|nr:50S ribosomal protein L2 [Candidatus Thermoplasmatota archaeon]
MGKRLISQRRGKASPVHQSPGHRHLGPAKHPKVPSGTTGTVTDIIHAPGRSAPMAEVEFNDGKTTLVIAAEGTHIGQTISFTTSDLKAGNLAYLHAIPEGTPVYNIEGQPGDGGKYVRAAGTAAFIVSREQDQVTVRMPSGQFKKFHPSCRATIGVTAGGGRGDKPLAKAGKVHHKYRSTGALFPRVRGVAKNPVDHPHGGGNAHRKEGKPTTLKRGTPPGRNVGHIAARRTGIRKG